MPLGPWRLSGGVVPIHAGVVLAVFFFCFRDPFEVELKRSVAQDALAIKHHQQVGDGIGQAIFHLWDENTDFAGCVRLGLSARGCLLCIQARILTP